MGIKRCRKYLSLALSGGNGVMQMTEVMGAKAARDLQMEIRAQR